MTWPFWRKPPTPITQPTAATSGVPARSAWRILPEALARFRAPVARAASTAPAVVTYKLPDAAPGVIPGGGKTAMAMDDAIGSVYAYANNLGFYAEGIGFMGYPYLAELSQRPEYRRMAETIAEEMTRKWVRLEVTGDDDKADKVKAIEAEIDRLKLRDTFRRAEELAEGMGMAHIYVDTGKSDDPDEMASELLVRDIKIAKGGLKGFRVIDPIWTSPTGYDSTNPLKPEFYKPQAWFVMGRKVHCSRLMTIVPRPMPDILKPAYNFGGLSLFQMAKPYVDNWLRTRQSVSDLLHSFTVYVLKTNMGSLMQGGGGEQMDVRMRMFNDMRDNRGLMAVDKDTEEFANVSAPLGGLDHLQAQAQEQQSSVSSIPLVKLLGITPSGLNASSDGEVRVFYDKIESGQERNFRDHLLKAIQIIQLHLFGEIDPEIGFRFEPLWQMDEAAKAAIRKTNADTAAVYIAAGVILPEEERNRVAAEDSSPYAGLDLSVILPAPDPANEEDPTGAGDPAAGAHRASEINGGSGV